ncbi:hypothetical protein THICB3600029 [Thiomonas sp. CB3]|nr:hypothetical protein THICB3600029 [Thiomonas sp. CB3]
MRRMNDVPDIGSRPYSGRHERGWSTPVSGRVLIFVSTMKFEFAAYKRIVETGADYSARRRRCPARLDGVAWSTPGSGHQQGTNVWALQSGPAYRAVHS